MAVIDVVTKKPLAPREYVPRGAAEKFGDRIFFTDELLTPDETENLGTRSGFCTRVRKLPGDADKFDCQTTYDFTNPARPRGQVTTRGLFTLPPQAEEAAKAAITGGTDDYANARGQVRVTYEEPPRYRLKLEIAL
jgi:allene oxide cyclase-like protein